MGNETVEGIVNVLPDDSVLITFTTNTSAPIYPVVGGLGTLIVQKQNDLRVELSWSQKGNIGGRWIGYYATDSASGWSGWKQIATAEPPTEYNVPFASEFVDRGQINDGIYASKYSKDQFGRVFVQISVQTVPFENTLQNVIGVGTIPVGFRPSRALVSTIEGSILTGGKTVGSFLVGTDGKIAISTAAKCAFAHGQITYLAAP